MKLRAVAAGLLIFLCLHFSPARNTDDVKPLELGSRLELFVDDTLIESMRGVELKLHPPRSAGRVLSFDRPWEGGTSDYISVFKDGDRYRMYYRGSTHFAKGLTVHSMLEPGETVTPDHPSFTCYAESRDGVHWTRPSLGLFEFNGSRDNNIVWTGARGDPAHCFMAFKDENPQASEDQRYKALANYHSPGLKHVMGVVSADGIHWRLIQDEPLITQAVDWGGDLAFWDSEREEYVAYLRGLRGQRVREVVRSTSPDFIHWTPPEFIDVGDTQPEHFYTNAANPYFRAPHIFLAFPRRMVPWRTLEPFRSQRYAGASDVVLLSSRDGQHWRRTFMEAFIRPGRHVRNWIHRANTPATGLVPTGPDELSLYVQRHYTFPSVHLERFVLRTDGFSSANAGAEEGELVTKPLTFEGDSLVLNFATSAAGGIQIEIQDVFGNPMPGFSLEESPIVWGDEIEHTVRWDRSRSRKTSEQLMRRIAGDPVKLRFVMKDADLYSLKFR